MTTLSLTPAYPVASKPCRVAFTLTGSGSNFLRAWVTDAPLGSSYRAKLDSTQLDRVEAYSGDTRDPWTFVPDVGGVYVLTVQEFTKGAGKTGGGYAGSPDGDTSEAAVGAPSSLSVHVGQRLTTRVGVGQDTATLVLYVFDSSVARTYQATHGENSPALIKPNSAKAKTATLDAAVVAAVDALAGLDASTAIGSIDDVLSDWRSKFNSHLTQTGVHYANDADHNMAAAFDHASAAAALADKVNQARELFHNHATDDKPFDDAHPTNPFGLGIAAYHQDGSSNNTADWSRLPIAGRAGPGDMASARVLVADLCRCYEAHRVATTNVHETADTTNALAALPALLQVDAAFLGVLTSQSPTAPATTNAGATLLLHGAGFTDG